MDDRILLGITGSAAAFKGIILASLLRKKGLAVDAILSPAAQNFVSLTQLSCVTGRPAYCSQFTDQPGDPVPHITLTDNCSLFVIAPATADFMAKAALGLADDLISATCLACYAPMVMAPSMNTRMWQNPATVANARMLTERGVVLAGPVEGELACGTIGQGRMMEPADILSICLGILSGE